jgi:hypothetical protein
MVGLCFLPDVLRGYFFPIVGLQDQSNVYPIRTLQLSILFSIRLAVGMRTRMMTKYRMDAI